jgi:hypothetical protein
MINIFMRRVPLIYASSIVFCAMFSGPLFVIVLSVFRLTAFSYPFLYFIFDLQLLIIHFYILFLTYSF